MRIKLTVYFDQEPNPVLFPTLPCPQSVSALRALIEERAKHTTKLISFWNHRNHQYDVLERIGQLEQPEALVSSDTHSGSSSSSPQRHRNTSTGMQVLSESLTGDTRTSVTVSAPLQQDTSDSRPVAQETCYRAQLWVESTLLVLEPVEPTRDANEFNELAAHVRQNMGNNFIKFTLQQASRVRFGYLERQFDGLRRNNLHTVTSRNESSTHGARDADDAEDEVRLLYYTNNAWPVTSVLQFGFLVRESRPSGNVLHRSRGETSPEPCPPRTSSSSTSPQREQRTRGQDTGQSLEDDTTRNPFLFSSSMVSPMEQTPPGDDGVVQKVLLCEVAPGRAWLSDCPLTGPGSEEALRVPPAGYDTVMYYQATGSSCEETGAHASAKHSEGCRKKGKSDLEGTRDADGAASTAAQFTQVRVSKSHQALPRYVLHVKAALHTTQPESATRDRSRVSGIASFFKAPIDALRSSPHRSSEARVEEVSTAKGGASDGRASSLRRRRQVTPPAAASSRPASPATPRVPQQQPSSGPSTNTSFAVVSRASPQQAQTRKEERARQSAAPPPPRSPARGVQPVGTVLYMDERLPVRSPDHTAAKPNSSGRGKSGGPLRGSSPPPPAVRKSPRSARSGALASAPKARASQQDDTYTSHRRRGPLVVRDASSYSQAGRTVAPSEPATAKQPGLLYSSSIPGASRPTTEQPDVGHQTRAVTPQRASSAHARPTSPENRRPSSVLPLRPSGILEQNAPTNISAFRCHLHRTYLTSLFCRTCRELTCPYCASVGPHRGHEVVEADEEAGHVSHRLQTLCGELGRWLDRFSRIETQLAMEQSDAARRQSQRMQHLHKVMEELRQAINQRERHLARELTTTALASSPSAMTDDPLRAASRVCDKYRRALTPLEDVLHRYQMAHIGQANGATASTTNATAHTLQFLRAAPALEKEALAYFERHDKQEEVELQMRVSGVREANERAEAVLQSLQVAALKKLVERIGAPQAQIDTTPRTWNGSVASSRATSPSREWAPAGGGGGGAGGSPGRASLCSPSRSSYDPWSTVSPSRRPRQAQPPLSAAQRSNTTTDDSLEEMIDVTATTSSSQANTGVANPRKAHALTHRCLLDLQRGHLWTIEDAARYFEPNQSQAVCSTAFRLANARWELRIGPLPKRGSAAAAAMGGAGPSVGRRISFAPTPTLAGSQIMPQSSRFTPGASTRGTPSLVYEAETGEEEWLGLFLFPLDHALRMDFRVIAFSEVCWMEWKVQGWAPEYAGKGWGLYPFLKRKDMMRTDKLACNNTVKLCVTPISDLY